MKIEEGPVMGALFSLSFFYHLLEGLGLEGIVIVSVVVVGSSSPFFWCFWICLITFFLLSSFSLPLLFLSWFSFLLSLFVIILPFLFFRNGECGKRKWLS